MLGSGKCPWMEILNEFICSFWNHCLCCNCKNAWQEVARWEGRIWSSSLKCWPFVTTIMQSLSFLWIRDTSKGAHYWVIRSHGSSCIMSYSCKWNHFLSQKYHITCKRKVEAPRQGAAKGKLKTSVVAYVVVSFMCDCIFNRKEKYKNYLILNKHKIAKFS